MSEGERRRAERVTVSIPARYWTSNESPANARNGTIDNISRGGLLLVSGETVAEGTRLHVMFEDKDGGRHEIVSDVVRSEARGGFGVSFVHVAESTLAYVRVALGVT